MAVIEGSSSGQFLGIGAETSVPGHVVLKPIFHGALGHYRFAIRLVLAPAQAANSRLLELRNTATTLIVLTHLMCIAVQISAGTAQENSIDAYKLTSFTASSTVNTVTPTSSVIRTSGMAAFPGGAAPRHVTLAGAAAGMTGGAQTKDAYPFSTFPFLVNAAVPTTPGAIWGPHDFLGRKNFDVYPFVFGQNEGLLLENRVLNVTSYGIALYIEIGWAEASAY